MTVLRREGRAYAVWHNGREVGSVGRSTRNAQAWDLELFHGYGWTHGTFASLRRVRAAVAAALA